MMKRIGIIVLLSVVLLFYCNSCTVSYSLTPTNVASNLKTFTIYDFPNRAPLINPNLSDYLVEKLRDRINRQTSLGYQTEGGDLEFEGTITGYEVQPMAIKSDDQASMNRLTVRVKVKFTNNKNHDEDFENEFSAYGEFSADQLLSDVEDVLIEAIVKELIDDIYNKTLANW